MWIPQKNEDGTRPQSSEQKTTSRTQETLSVSFKFPKSARLLSRAQFQKVSRQGSRLHGKVLSMQYIRSLATRPKLGVTVSKKFGKAHERNRFKRVIREAFREFSPLLPSNIEMVVFPKLTEGKLTKQVVLEDFTRIFKDFC